MKLSNSETAHDEYTGVTVGVHGLTDTDGIVYVLLLYYVVCSHEPMDLNPCHASKHQKHIVARQALEAINIIFTRFR